MNTAKYPIFINVMFEPLLLKIASYEKIRTEFGKNSEITDPVKVKEVRSCKRWW